MFWRWGNDVGSCVGKLPMFGIGFGLKLGVVDNKPFVGALSYEFHFVPCGHFKDEPAAVHFDQFALTAHCHSHGSGSTMGNVDMGAHGAFVLGKERCHAFGAGFFHQRHHHGGGKHSRQSATHMGGGEFGGNGEGLLGFDTCGYHLLKGGKLLKYGDGVGFLMVSIAQGCCEGASDYSALSEESVSSSFFAPSVSAGCNTCSSNSP